MPEVTQQRLKEILSYDSVTGNFTWIKGNHNRVGRIAGCKCLGYIHIAIKGKIYKAHRLAWLYTYGEWPSQLIDHINGVKDDNRLLNLRPANYAENGQNRKKNKVSKSKYKCVRWREKEGKWNARITINGVRKSLGYFNTELEAHKAYCLAADINHKEFSNYGD